MQIGISQGCPLSALLVILAVEVLAVLSLELRSNKSINMVIINNEKRKLTQLVDDTVLI